MFIHFDGSQVSRWEERDDDLQRVPLEELPKSLASKFKVPGKYQAFQVNPKVPGAARFSIMQNPWNFSRRRFPACYSAKCLTGICKPFLRLLTGKITIDKQTDVACSITLVKAYTDGVK